MTKDKWNPKTMHIYLNDEEHAMVKERAARLGIPMRIMIKGWIRQGLGLNRVQPVVEEREEA